MGPFVRLAALASFAISIPTCLTAAWHQAKSKHFIIYADLTPDRIRAYAERLERFDRAVRLVRGMDDPTLTDAQRLTVYALRNEDAVADLIGSGAAVGLYLPNASGSSAFVPRKAGSDADWDLDTEEIFFHEYAHHLQLEASSFALPPWTIEGFAEFFATAKVEQDGSVVIGNPPQYRAFGLLNETGLSLSEMVGATYYKLDYGEYDLLYGLGWLLTHYLTFEPSRKGQLDHYVADIQKGVRPLDAAKRAFGDLKVLDRELNKYKRGKFRGLRVNGDQLSPGPIAVRPLTSGESAMMRVHMRSRRGVDKMTARDVAADARRIALRFPDEPFVQTALAEAEFDRGDFPAAEAAADRALARDPKNVRALIYKGRARMELAKGNRDADWASIRHWFTKANRLDTEHAEPLMMYYKSYEYAASKPTSNAVKGLLYAVALVPQDRRLRLEAVRQLLTDGRLDEARRYYAALAFRPHVSRNDRETSGKVIAAIDAGDAATALTAINAALKAEDSDDRR